MLATKFFFLLYLLYSHALPKRTLSQIESCKIIVECNIYVVTNTQNILAILYSQHMSL